MTIAALNKFPAEKQLIGEILTAYGELEFDLCLCVAMGIDNLDAAIKQMFGVRGETKRVNIAEQLGKPAYQKVGLSKEFDETIAAMRHCLAIRNQFAHAYYHDNLSGRLSFIHLEEIATQTAPITDLMALTFKYLDVPLLHAQRTYVTHTSDFLRFVNFEGRTIRNLIRRTSITKPAQLAQPKPHL